MALCDWSSDVCSSDLISVEDHLHSTSIPVITERDHDTSHLKIGLLNVRYLTSKAIIVNELITDHNLDLIGLTETWLKPDEFTVLNEASPPGYTSDHIPCPSRKGGGVANIYDSRCQFTKKNDVFIF